MPNVKASRIPIHLELSRTSHGLLKRLGKWIMRGAPTPNFSTPFAVAFRIAALPLAPVFLRPTAVVCGVTQCASQRRITYVPEIRGGEIVCGAKNSYPHLSEESALRSNRVFPSVLLLHLSEMVHFVGQRSYSTRHLLPYTIHPQKLP